ELRRHAVPRQIEEAWIATGVPHAAYELAAGGRFGGCGERGKIDLREETRHRQTCMTGWEPVRAVGRPRARSRSSERDAQVYAAMRRTQRLDARPATAAGAQWSGARKRRTEGVGQTEGRGFDDRQPGSCLFVSRWISTRFADLAARRA